jgi:hypothetical protein
LSSRRSSAVAERVRLDRIGIDLLSYRYAEKFVTVVFDHPRFILSEWLIGRNGGDEMFTCAAESMHLI